VVGLDELDSFVAALPTLLESCTTDHPEDTA
jgi:hypothetical protein